jgi:hypothetical protein
MLHGLRTHGLLSGSPYIKFLCSITDQDNVAMTWGNGALQKTNRGCYVHHDLLHSYLGADFEAIGQAMPGGAGADNSVATTDTGAVQKKKRKHE